MVIIRGHWCAIRGHVFSVPCFKSTCTECLVTASSEEQKLFVVKTWYEMWQLNNEATLKSVTY